MMLCTKEPARSYKQIREDCQTLQNSNATSSRKIVLHSATQVVLNRELPENNRLFARVRVQVLH